MNRRTLVSLSAAAMLLAGCSTLKKFTGQNNDTVLPGEREAVLPPENYTAKTVGTAGQQSDPPLGEAPPPVAKSGTKNGTACNPEVDPECVPPDDGAATTGDDTFSDG